MTKKLFLMENQLARFAPPEILQRIQTQVSSNNSYVIYKATGGSYRPFSESNSVKNTLRLLAETYRSAGLKKGDERIDPTVSFVVLKYIGENEKGQRTLNEVIKLWEDFIK